ncbi:MAG TPA: type I phosphomannose isomerase catalytic subunit [Candidatus Aquilonibacter sp.]|jgi:mannose-6-phosphate isomerase|nr:type I phosphomannose isomerase catalytic subunit [Candidatus Aquilonibacter sp.]
MSDLYPLLMVPSFDPRPWGTHDLTPIYPNHKFEEKIGEAWLTGDQCKIQNGPLAGQTLAQLSEQYQQKLVGDAARDARRFPLLLKFLFPHEKLSVQVHPDDEQAHRVSQPWGKTECWYVAHAKPGSQIGLGLKTGVTVAQLEEAIYEKHAEDLLNWLNVYTGDMIYVSGGTVHTLGPGSVIVETQQQSDTTYRLYDYGRPRELHLKDGMAAVKLKVASGKVRRPAPMQIEGSNNRQASLIAAPYFVVDMFEMKSAVELHTQDDSGKTSAQILVAVEGCGVVETAGAEAVTLAKGDAVVVPASLEKFTVRPQWTIELLRARVPGAALPEPETRM